MLISKQICITTKAHHEQDIQLRAPTAAKIIFITVLNVLIVSCTSVLSVNGNGTAGGMCWIQGAGLVWVLGFSIRAYFVATTGNEKAAIEIAASSLLYGFAAALVFGLLWDIIKTFVK